VKIKWLLKGKPAIRDGRIGLMNAKTKGDELLKEE
jgi:hypothetical protein